MEFALLQFSIEAMLLESAEDFKDMLFMRCKVLGVDEDIIKIYDNTYVQHIGKDTIDKMLESHWGIGESLRHYQPLIQAITCAECSLPLISFCHANKMVGRAVIYFGVDFCMTWRI